MDILDDDELLVTHSVFERTLFTVSHKIKHLLLNPTTVTAPTAIKGAGVKLPKLNVPTFDGNIIHWRHQFTVTVYSKTSLFNAEKTVYLQQTSKDCTAKNVTEGLSHSGDNYEEAVECLQSHYKYRELMCN